MKLTQNQQLWADIFRCAVNRSNIYFTENNLDRHAREHTTVVLALQKGDQFWRELF